MEFFKQWSMCVCLSLIVSVVFSLIAPKGSMQRFYRVLISVFILVSFLLPLKNAPSFRLDWSAFGLVNETEQNRQTVYQNYICRAVENYLTDHGIQGAHVSCKVLYRADSGEIDVQEITVALPDEYDCRLVQKDVLDDMGFNARVIHLGE